jgi:hypothetical protein
MLLKLIVLRQVVEQRCAAEEMPSLNFRRLKYAAAEGYGVPVCDATIAKYLFFVGLKKNFISFQKPHDYVIPKCLFYEEAFHNFKDYA